MGILKSIGAGADAIAAGLGDFATYSARAAANANAVSRSAQRTQGEFNQNSANIANMLGDQRLAQMYGFNSAQAAEANEFTEYMWNKAAQWNEYMFDKQAAYNREEANKQRTWSELMANTAYQRTIADLKAAGINPILAVQGLSPQSASGSAASISAPSMNAVQGHMASGSTMNALSASEGNYSGQMEYMGGLLGLLSAGLQGLSTAITVAGQNDSIGTIIEKFLDKLGPIKANEHEEEYLQEKQKEKLKEFEKNIKHSNIL